MENIEFTSSELEYIDKDVFDYEQDIYVYAKYPNMPKCLPNTYSIACKNLPIGTYSLKGKNIDLHFNTQFMLAYGKKGILDTRYTENNVLNFIIKKPCDRILLQAKKCKSKNIENLVKELRKQALINKNKLEQQNNLSL